MLLGQIDSVLQKDDEHRKAMGLQMVKTPRFYPSSTQLWVEMPVDIIKKASEEHEELSGYSDNQNTQA